MDIIQYSHNSPEFYNTEESASKHYQDRDALLHLQEPDLIRESPLLTLTYLTLQLHYLS